MDLIGPCMLQQVVNGPSSGGGEPYDRVVGGESLAVVDQD